MPARSKQEIIAAMDAVRSRIAEIDGTEWPTDAEVDEAEGLPTRLEELKTEAARADQEHADRVARVRSVAMNPRAMEGQTPYRARGGGLSGEGDDLRSRAMRLVDSAHRTDELSAEAAQRAEALVSASGRTPAERETAAHYMVVTGSDAYRSAVAKMLVDPIHGHQEFDRAEAAAFRDGRELQRAMSLTDSAGGFLVPFTLDPTIILTNAGSVNPMRQISRVVTTATDVWHGVTSAGVTAEWLAEAEEAADASPTFGSPDIKPEKAAAWVQGSFEVLGDSGFASQVAPLLADAKDQLEAVAFMVGDGIGKPEGVITGVAAVSGSRVVSAGSGVVTSADVYALQAALPPRHQGRARWLADLAVLNHVDQMETTAGAKLFGDLGSGTLLRHPVYEASAMNGVISAGSDVLLYGDFQNYLIVDRIGMTLVYEPLVKGANGRPTGEAGWFAYWRTGGGVLVSDAFRLLRVKA